jgi:hypothetical protein
MNRYERRLQFERWYALRQAYRTADPMEHRAVISIDEALRLADALTADAGQAGEPGPAAQADADRAGRPSQL